MPDQTRHLVDTGIFDPGIADQQIDAATRQGRLDLHQVACIRAVLKADSGQGAAQALTHLRIALANQKTDVGELGSTSNHHAPLPRSMTVICHKG